jgi:hypothetical protein
MIAGMQRKLDGFGKTARLKTERFANWDNNVDKLLDTYQIVNEMHASSSGMGIR